MNGKTCLVCLLLSACWDRPQAIVKVIKRVKEINELKIKLLYLSGLCVLNSRGSDCNVCECVCISITCHFIGFRTSHQRTTVESFQLANTLIHVYCPYKENKYQDIQPGVDIFIFS